MNDKEMHAIYREALKISREHIIKLHPRGDPRREIETAHVDSIQIAVLNIIDAALGMENDI